MKKLFLSALLMVFVYSVRANNLKIDNVAYDKATNALSFDISWENSWNISDEFHDAAWFFAKYKASNSAQWQPVDMDAATITASGLDITSKGVGFIARNAAFTDGQADIPVTTVTITGMQLSGINPSFKVFGTEMVYVPEGNFELGDGSQDSLVFINQTDINPAVVTSTTTFVYIREDDSSIAQKSLGADFPTGYKAFYCMKYEITQGQIRDFFNTLSGEQLFRLTWFNFVNNNKYPIAFSETPVNRMGIAYIENNTATAGIPSVFGMDLNNNGIFDEPEDGATLACNFLSRNDMLAFLDWAGLRPMTEMEYEKACRGTDPAIRDEYATGVPFNTIGAGGEFSAAGTQEETYSVINLNLMSGLGPLRVGFAATAGSNRYSSGNSYYGIANLSDNLSERVIKAEREGFTYDLHGDGKSTAASSLGRLASWELAPMIIRGGSFYNMSDGSAYGHVSDRDIRANQLDAGGTGGRGVLSAQ